MLAICHGDAKQGATHVPIAAQQHIERVAAASHVSCAVLDKGVATCWGAGLAAPDPAQVCLGSATDIKVAVVDGLARAALVCSDASLVSWDASALPVYSTVSSASGLSSAPTALCYATNSNAVCWGVSATLLAPWDGDVERVWAGDQGACIKRLSADAIECVGRYSQTSVAWRAGHALQDARLAGGAMCFQWDDGWQCQTASGGVMGDDEATAVASALTLWPLTQTTPTSDPIPFLALDVSAAWGSASAQLCAAREASKQTWCQGTGFNDTGDVVDGIYSINSQYTAATRQIALSTSHVCVTVEDATEIWPWIAFGAILLFILAAFAVAWWHYRKEAQIEANPYKWYADTRVHG